MYGSPITKEIKKKHSPRPVGVAEMYSQGRGLSGRWQLEDWGRQSHICVQINWEELWSETDRATQSSSVGK